MYGGHQNLATAKVHAQRVGLKTDRYSGAIARRLGLETLPTVVNWPPSEVLCSTLGARDRRSKSCESVALRLLISSRQVRSDSTPVRLAILGREQQLSVAQSTVTWLGRPVDATTDICRKQPTWEFRHAQ